MGPFGKEMQYTSMYILHIRMQTFTFVDSVLLKVTGIMGLCANGGPNFPPTSIFVIFGIKRRVVTSNIVFIHHDFLRLTCIVQRMINLNNYFHLY